LSASLHFAPTETAADNLRRESAKGLIHVVGNTSIDAAFEIARTHPGPSDSLLLLVPALRDPARRFVLVTAHRRENFGVPLRNILAAVKEIASENTDLDVIWPVHPNPNVASMVHEIAGNTPNIHLTEPVSYGDLIYLIKRSHLVLTDSGGIQEEAPAFDKPVVVLRNTTERPEGVAAGCSVVAGTNTSEILRYFNGIYRDAETYRRMSQALNPYGDGTASRRIVDAIVGAA
jgi:UDP-N-acetylglucosamine 2-epimerase (non-hydrolysing)